MIASINLDTNEVRLCSVMRDTWLNQGTDTYRKANAAYATGGPKQAISMLNMNLDLNISDFVTVGFDGLIDAIDAVGGVEIDVKEAEIVHINSYQISIVGHETGTLNAAGEPEYYAEPYVEYTPVTTAGTQILNGLQATAYCRVRYVGNDFERTSRQRTVLTKLAKKAMTLNPTTLNNIADAVFPQVYTSLTKSEILSLLAGVASYSVGDNTNFPFDGYVQTGRINSASVVVPVDLEKNVSLLHEFLFDEVGYEPTETVKKCSQKIVSDSGMSYSGD
jgi:LCP family protein required for cell wall assembly